MHDHVSRCRNEEPVEWRPTNVSTDVIRNYHHVCTIDETSNEFHENSREKTIRAYYSLKIIKKNIYIYSFLSKVSIFDISSKGSIKICEERK